MLPDLSPHLHTEECNTLVDFMNRCFKEKSFGRYFGACNDWNEAVWQCTKQERIWRRDHNPKYGKRIVELKQLPYEYYTPTLKRLKAEGKLHLESDVAGCKI